MPSASPSHAEPVVVRHAEDLSGMVGRRVTLEGVMRACRNPTVLGVWVAAAQDACLKRARVTGVLRRRMVEAPPVDEPPMAMHAPGRYYVLEDVRTGALARALGVE